MEKTEKNTERRFTPAEANATLPYVERVIRDIVETHKLTSELYNKWRRLTDGESASVGDTADEVVVIAEYVDGDIVDGEVADGEMVEAPEESEFATVEHDDQAGAETEAVEDQIRDLLETREQFVGELESVGCQFKDFQLGLVDFPARLGDRDVYLCWQLGEPEVLYWHELHDGFSGRKLIAEYFD